MLEYIDRRTQHKREREDVISVGTREREREYREVEEGGIYREAL